MKKDTGMNFFLNVGLIKIYKKCNHKILRKVISFRNINYYFFGGCFCPLSLAGFPQKSNQFFFVAGPIFDPNLVSIGQMVFELPCSQNLFTYTHIHTHRRQQFFLHFWNLLDLKRRLLAKKWGVRFFAVTELSLIYIGEAKVLLSSVKFTFVEALVFSRKYL